MENKKINVKVGRNEYIGGSDIPTILGLNRFKSRETLLKEKAGIEINDFQGNEYTEFGNICEPLIRLAYIILENEKGNQINEVIPETETVENYNDFKLVGHTDGIIKWKDNTFSIMEIKTHGGNVLLDNYKAQLNFYRNLILRNDADKYGNGGIKNNIIITVERPHNWLLMLEGQYGKEYYDQLDFILNQVINKAKDFEKAKKDVSDLLKVFGDDRMRMVDFWEKMLNGEVLEVTELSEQDFESDKKINSEIIFAECAKFINDLSILKLNGELVYPEPIKQQLSVFMNDYTEFKKYEERVKIGKDKLKEQMEFYGIKKLQFDKTRITYQGETVRNAKDEVIMDYDKILENQELYDYLMENNFIKIKHTPERKVSSYLKIMEVKKDLF